MQFPSGSHAESLARRVNQQGALYRFTDRLHRAETLFEVYEAALDAILSALECDRASILIFDDGGVMRFVGWRDLSEGYRRAVEGHSPWRPDERDAVPILMRDVLAEDLDPHLKAVISEEGIRSLAFVPVQSSGKLLGKFMIYFNGPHDFTDNELGLALTIGRQIAFGVERKRAEEALRRERERLEQSEEALREADRRKDEFLATLAHELRNPLAPIRNAVQVQKAMANLEPQLAWTHGVIDRQVRHMTRLLEDLLDVSRISRNKLELRKERVELSNVMDAALETTRPLMEAAGHRLDVSMPEAPVWLDADPVRLAQVFANLLNNAAKYTDDGGVISLRATHTADEVVVSIHDPGIGIASDMLPRIFEIFSQAKPALERTQGGLGIGLSLTKHLVEAHGGRIEARSDGPGTGSEFVVHLPALVPTDGKDQNRSNDASPDALPSRRILILDDNQDSADSLSLLLRLSGHETHAVYGPTEAMNAASTLRPDVLLLDIGLPKISGYEVCRQIRAEPWGKSMVMVALTGWGQDEDRRKSREAGFDHHLTKPVDYRRLMHVLGSSPPASRVST